MRTAVYIGAGAALAAFLLIPKTAKQSAFNLGWVAASPRPIAFPAVPTQSRTTALDSVVSSVVAGIGGPSTNKARALGLIRQIDAQEFGGWFAMGGRSHSDVMAIFQIESGFDFNAVGDRTLTNGPSYGIGQVLRTTAPELGIGDVSGLFDPYTGVKAAMTYLRKIWDDVARRRGRAPSVVQWVGAYNAGPRGSVERGLPWDYIAKWQAAKIVGAGRV